MFLVPRKFNTVRLPRMFLAWHYSGVRSLGSLSYPFPSFHCATSQHDLWHCSGPRRSSRNDWKKLRRKGNKFKLLRPARRGVDLLPWDVEPWGGPFACRTNFEQSCGDCDKVNVFFFCFRLKRWHVEGCWASTACTCANHVACTCGMCIMDVCTRDWLPWSHNVFPQWQ